MGAGARWRGPANWIKSRVLKVCMNLDMAILDMGGSKFVDGHKLEEEKGVQFIARVRCLTPAQEIAKNKESRRKMGVSAGGS